MHLGLNWQALCAPYSVLGYRSPVPFRWEDIIKMALQEVGCGGMDWIELGQDRARWRELVNVVVDLRVP
jgi:hypothetical protein